VQTETYTQKRAGEGFANGQDARGTHLPVYPDLQGQECAFQMNFFDGYQSKRLTWGTQFGSLYGGGGATAGYQDYSLAMHLGRYSDHGVAQLISETEGIHDGTVSVRALTGALITSGPEGTGNPTPHTYSPGGYNAVYRTWELQGLGNVASLSFNVHAGSFKRPVFVVHGYTGINRSSVEVSLNGARLATTAYTVSIDASAHALYVTLLSTLTGDNVVLMRDSSAVEDAGAVVGGSAPVRDGGLLAVSDAGVVVASDAGVLVASDAGVLVASDAGIATASDGGVVTLPDAGADVCTLGDGDGDGVCDNQDNCTACYNPDQADVDHDGLGDCWRCDWCAGAGTDTDYDGLCDGADNCPTTWNQSQRDSDGDGVGDACDNCPKVANANQADANHNGIGDACE
jgi:hypothetical protein